MFTVLYRNVPRQLDASSYFFGPILRAPSPPAVPDSFASAASGGQYSALSAGWPQEGHVTLWDMPHVLAYTRGALATLQVGEYVEGDAGAQLVRQIGPSTPFSPLDGATYLWDLTTGAITVVAALPSVPGAPEPPRCPVVLFRAPPLIEAPAGQPYSVTVPVTVESVGVATAPVRIRSDVVAPGGQNTTQTLWQGQAGAIPTSVTPQGDMPWDDATLTLTAECQQPNATWLGVGSAATTLAPQFAQASFAGVNLPTAVRAGQPVNGTVDVQNDGAIGETGVDLLDPQGGLVARGPLTRVTGGAITRSQYSGEMAPAFSQTLVWRPKSLGRGKQEVAGASATHVIQASDTFFIDKGAFTMRGSGESNLVVGLIAARDLYVPFAIQADFDAPVMPYGAVPFVLDLGQEGVMSYSELYFLQFKTQREVSVVENGRTSSRGTLVWQKSRVPLPTGLSFQLRSLFTQLTARRGAVRRG